MYRRLTYDFGDTIEVEENYPCNYGAQGKRRMKRRKPTPEQIKKQNQKNREKQIRRIMKANFREGDIWLTLTYRAQERPPDIQAATKDIKKFLEKMRGYYRRRGHLFKWMLHTEVGSRGGVHHHLAINRIPDYDLLIRKAWDKGGAHIDLMYRELEKLSAYLAKEPDEKNKLKESRYSRSRNLKVPIPKKKILVRWIRVPRPKKGYYIDKNSYHEGENPITGHKYRAYTMIRLNRRI